MPLQVRSMSAPPARTSQAKKPSIGAGRSPGERGKARRCPGTWRMAKFSSLTFSAVPEGARQGEEDSAPRRRTRLPWLPGRISAEIQFCVFHWCQAIAFFVNASRGFAGGNARSQKRLGDSSTTTTLHFCRPPPSACLPRLAGWQAGWSLCLDSPPTPTPTLSATLSLSARRCFSGLEGARAETAQSQA